MTNSKDNSKTQLERMQSVQEVEQKVYALKLDKELAGQILLRTLELYVVNGQTFINKRIKLQVRGDIPREFIVNLFNDKTKRDWVRISAIQNTQNIGTNVDGTQSMTLKY